MHSKNSSLLIPHPTWQARKLLLERLPESPGVYLMYGRSDEILYIGKSKSIRSRVRAHFGNREERKMCRQVTRIDARKTPGELGALLLESELIKELKPIYNKRLRRQRRMIIARKVMTPDGYARIALEAVSALEASRTDAVMALFRTKTQAKEYLASMAKEHRLCLSLLGLQRTKQFCFGYHLHRCNGACGGEEAPALYNTRLESAFEERRIHAWPFEGAVIIDEQKSNGNKGEVFLVDHWCLLFSYTYSFDTLKLRVKASHRFDYDAYKILASYIFNETNRRHMRVVQQEELTALMEKLKAA